VSLIINDHSVQVVADEKKTVLIDLLRDGLGLVGAKQSCDRKGQCGTCMVLVNGKAVLSCITKVAALEGATVTTIEGFGTPEHPHLLQQAFVLAGAVQCGFCIPGMIASAKALLDVNPDPTREEIKRALRRNLCRCTGYVKIIDAVQLAGRFLRGEISPADVTPDPNGPKIGVSHPRPSALAKVCGTAAFGADIRMPGALELAVVRSPHFHALIKGIDTAAAEAMPGVVGVMTAADIKGTNRIKGYTVADRPILCDDKVHTLGDAVAIVAAQTKEQALAAVEAVKVEYEPLPELTSPVAAMVPDAPRVHPESPNLCFSQPIIKGDAASAFERSAAVVEDRFKTQINHQAALEPEVSVAYWEGEGEDAELVVIGRSINIHLALSILQTALGWEAIRYEEAFSGGQFGITLEVIAEPIAAAAALHFRRAVRYVPSLAESMLMTSKRHPFDIAVKLGADADGKLNAMSMDITVDNGAYMSAGIVILNRALHMLSSSYYIPNISVTSRVVYTNNPWGSAARGAGPPQTHYALECAVDMLAEKMGIDPLDFRQRNSLQPGQTKATGHVVQEWPFPGLCDAIRPRYEAARREAAAFRGNRVRRGVGLGAAAFGIAMPGDKSIAAVELDPDDGVTVYVAAADPGEGNDSMLSQLTAHVLGLPLSKVRIVTRDTGRTTASGPASGSRVTYMIGGATVDAAGQLKRALEEVGDRTHAALLAAGRPTRYVGRRTTLETAPLDSQTGQGPSFEVEVFSIQLAEVDVDTETGEVKVVRITSAADPGRVIHPQNVEGQLEGGMDMGAGFALREQFIAGKTRDWISFKFPTMRTAFDMGLIIRETPRNLGTLGAVGVGEMAMVATAPAIVNAIRDACGAMIYELPATPERVKAALAQAQRHLVAMEARGARTADGGRP
jgi:aldehyde oxidoreductase